MSRFILSAFADEINDQLKTQMDVLESHDIKFIEMRGVNGKLLVHHTLEEVQEIKRQMDERGFKLSAIGSPIGKINITDDFRPHLQLFKHTLEIAEIMECKYIRMFSFFMPKGEDPSVYREEVINRWRSFIQVTEGKNVVLLHENESGIYGDTPERCFDLLETLNCEYVKGIFDFANFVQCNAKNYPEAFMLLKDYIAYIHVKDAVYSDHHVVPAGKGDGNVSEILQELYKTGYDGFLSLEPHLWNYSDFSLLTPDSPGYDLPVGGEKRFAVAVRAIKNIINKIQ
ncbi:MULTISPECIES: sugar phosphate isomerase/epimerase family protein [Bacillaceae]|uniref:Sugar phosphate isomerase/epimerase family protein n=1 Tax=Niallia hominis TaxID=3133173 RepID=A0ABV1F3Z5_9BACI|nr:MULTISPECIES: sugar phosphate isomerase/epimerase family protein [Bacillaceae]MCF2647828.1 sugar phosphate isomerase/epimerase [Niallia circulans]MCM3362284.1 sugar phosphate isomerase/epimerase [Niallia sp. MER TA 168]